jgi:hypothetical protein
VRLTPFFRASFFPGVPLRGEAAERSDTNSLPGRDPAGPRGAYYAAAVATAGVYDVLVVGGGAAGIGAALAAASHGAHTLLVEQAPALGGNATGALVHTLCGLYLADVPEPRPANPGLPMRFAEGLRRSGGAGEPERAGRVWVLPTDPPAIERFAADWCAAQPCLEVWLGCAVTSAYLAPDAFGHSRLALQSADGRGLEVSGSVVVDASGDGVLGALGGAACDRAAPHAVQLPSFIARLSGVPAADREGFGRLRLARAVAGAARLRALPPDCEAVLLRPAPGSEDAYLTLNLPRGDADPARSPEARRALEARARAHVEAIVAHLRATRPGHATCRVVAWPRQLGVREGARLRGRVVIEEAALLRGQRGPEDVALSTWPVELWHDPRRPILRHPEGPSGIPLGALVSLSHPRLGMAGRVVSASHEALGALRVLGTALATGEAIGTAAALAADAGIPLADVAPGRVRRAIEDAQEKPPPASERR